MTGINSAIAIATAPLVMLLVHLVQMITGLDNRFLPAISLGASLLVVAVYVISTTGFAQNGLYDYLVAVVVLAASASGLYSWGKTVSGSRTNRSTNRAHSLVVPATTSTGTGTSPSEP